MYTTIFFEQLLGERPRRVTPAHTGTYISIKTRIDATISLVFAVPGNDLGRAERWCRV
jgi:hypothetical protein